MEGLVVLCLCVVAVIRWYNYIAEIFWEHFLCLDESDDDDVEMRLNKLLSTVSCDYCLGRVGCWDILVETWRT